MLWAWLVAIALVCVGVGVLGASTTPSPCPTPKDPCAPFFVGAHRCGKLCQYQSGVVIKGCAPLRRAVGR